MRIGLPVFLAMAVTCCVLPAAPARAAESQAEAILDLSHSYSADWEFGRMAFSADIPELDELTPDERELLEDDWLTDMLELISCWPGFYLELPERITTNNLRYAFQSESASVHFTSDMDAHNLWSAYQERFLCPLTCRYPRLNSAEFSKGNFYMFILTPQEQIHILAMLEQERGMTDDQLQTYIDSQAICYRFYGESGVLVQGILWAPMFDMWGEQPHIIPARDDGDAPDE